MLWELAAMKGENMPLWLVLIVVGVILALIGVFVPAAQFLIWLGIIILVVSIIMSLLTGRRQL